MESNNKPRIRIAANSDALTTVKSGLYPLPISGGYVSADWDTNWWQRGMNPIGGGTVATLEACLGAYAQTIAQIRPYHEREQDNGAKGRVRVFNSALSRLLRNPNSYQTSSDFWLNGVRSLLASGAMHAVAQRNDRNEVESWHLVGRGTNAYVEPETREVFYAVGDNPMLGDIDVMIPARDVLHIRLYTPNHPLVGVSPIEAAVHSLAVNGSITAHQASFFARMSRPSGVLSSDQKMNREQMRELRAAWEEQSKGMDAGGVPILGSGVKWEPMSVSSQDAQLVDAFNMSINDIARAFRVPLPMIQQHSEGSTYNNVEQLFSHWLSGGLGFMIEHIERAVEKFLKLGPADVVHFDTDMLLRTDFAARVEGYTSLSQGGLLTINEARRDFGNLPPVPNGDVPYVQQQMVPLGWTPPEPEPNPEPEPGPEPVVEDNIDPEVTKALVVNLVQERKKRTAE